MPQINIRLKHHFYPIVIGSELNKQLVKFLKKHAGTNRVFIFFDSAVYALYGKKLEKQLSSIKMDFVTFVIPGGEESKSQETLDQIFDFLLSEKISRTDFILAVGGGVITDLIGYAAASILRGVKWGAVSTTLLGMVDAAIGGKTGINHPRGKNLIGAFWQPSFVICDLNYLHTLPEREFFAGLGEVLKYAGLIGPKMDTLLKKYFRTANLFDLKKLQPLVQISAGYKAKIVMADERESNLRMLLNLGHSFAHAFEKTLGYGKLVHGETVVIGLLTAVSLSKKVNPKSAAALKEYENLVKEFLALVRYYPMSTEIVLNNMKLDKKRTGLTQKFVLLNRPGKPFIASGLKEQTVKEALEVALSIYKELGGLNG